MEMLETTKARLDAMAEYLGRLYEGPVDKETYAAYSPILASATAWEVNEVLDRVLVDLDAIETWKVPVARFIRSVSRALDAEMIPDYPKDSLFFRLESENSAIEAELSAVQAAIRSCQAGQSSLEDLRLKIGGIDLLKDHYRTLQYELFPLFEKASARHRCLSLMWSLQDEVLALQARIAGEDAGAAEQVGRREDPGFWRLLGAFYMTAGMLLYRERRILYPVAFRALPERLWQTKDGVPDAIGASGCTGPTGSLDQEELEMILKALPLDFSFIGPDDRVKFYSDPPHRIFPRAPAVIGRKVQNCHPPKSVALVEEILRSFKEGTRDKAEFWLDAKGSFVHIEYFALRDSAGTYRGTLEVSQDATRLRSLEGEKRLL